MQSHLKEGDPRGDIPTIILGQEFSPFTLPGKDYYGFPGNDIRRYANPKVRIVNLRTGILPDLEMNFITFDPIQPVYKLEKESGRVVYVENDVVQSIELGLVRVGPWRSSSPDSERPKSFNEDILPIVRNLRLKMRYDDYIKFKGSLSEGSLQQPEEEHLTRRGRIHFAFSTYKEMLNKHFKIAFSLESPSINEK